MSVSSDIYLGVILLYFRQVHYILPNLTLNPNTHTTMMDDSH